MKAEQAPKKKQKAYAFILEKTGLTIKDAAEYLGCNPVFLGQVLRGRKKASKMFFLHLDRAFCISNEKIKMRVNWDVDLLKKEIEEIAGGAYTTQDEVDKANAKIKHLNYLCELINSGQDEKIKAILMENINQIVAIGKQEIQKQLEKYNPKSFYFAAPTNEKAFFMAYLEKSGVWRYE